MKIYNSVAHIVADADGRFTVGELPENVRTVRIHREPSAEPEAIFNLCAAHDVPAAVAQNYLGLPMSEIEKDIRRVTNIKAICAATNFGALTDVFTREGVSVDVVKAVIVNVRAVIDRSVNIDSSFAPSEPAPKAGIDSAAVYDRMNTPKE